MNIIWSAPCDVSGYSYCARDYVLALGENGTNIQFHTPVISRLLEGLGIDHETKKRLSTYTSNEITGEYVKVWHSIPDRFAVDRNAILNIGYTVVETEKIPERWVFMCNQMDAIFTASEFCKRILIKNGVVVPVIVVPHCHDPKQFKTKSKYNITNLKSFNFLFMADMTPRKGWEQLIQAYCEEFKPNEDVSLTMKVYYGDFSDEAQLRCRNKIKQAAQRWGYHVNHSTAPVYFYGHCLPNSCVSRFVNTFDCIVSPHCAEGWGLVCSQGMLLGKPVVATEYSGNLEFMNGDNSYLVKVGRIEKVPQEMIDINSNYAGAVWPVIDVQKLRHAMRHAFENQKEAKKIGMKARKHIADNYSHKVVSSIIKRAIESLLDEKTKRNNSNIQHTGLGGNLS